MKVIEEIDALHRILAGLPGEASVALVPTMGNLHQGHLALMREARKRAHQVVASIFVNPIQFGPGEDFERYPRTVEADLDKLRKVGVGMVFLPSVASLYPRGPESVTRLKVPSDLADQLCGASRPGHFDGVATVVSKLFNIVQPDLAVFGEKDYQQLMVLRRMVQDLNFPVDVVAVPTEREDDGLAMSSRNGYLSESERRCAPRLFETLGICAESLRLGRKSVEEVEQWGMQLLREGGFEPEYLAVRDAVDLSMPGPDARDWIILAAGRLGTTRLIDNLRVYPDALLASERPPF